MQKQISKKPLPKLDNSQSIHLDQSKDPSVKGLATAITLAMIPVIRSTNKTLVDSMNLMSSYLLSELPDLGLIGGYVEDFAKDLLGKPNPQKQAAIIDDQAKDIKIIKKENMEHTVMFDMLFRELEEIILSIRDLTSVTSNVWGVSKDQLDVIKTSNSIMREQEKLSKFNLQKEKAGDTFSLKGLTVVTGDKKKDHPFLKLLEQLALGRLIPIIAEFAIGALEIFLGGRILKGILTKIAPKLVDKMKFMKTASGGLDKIKGSASGAFKKASAVPKSSGFSKTLSKVAPLGSGLKAIGKYAVKGAGILGMAAGGIGAIQGAYRGLDEGKRGVELMHSIFAGFIDAFLSPFKEILGMDFLNYDTLTDGIANSILIIHNKFFEMIESVTSSYTKLTDSIKGSVDTVFQKVTSMWDSITTTFEDTLTKLSNIFTGLKDAFLDTIRQALQKIIPTDNKINFLGADMKFAPDSLYEFAYPKSSVEPSSKQDQRTIDMMSNQSKIDESYTRYGTPSSPNISSVVNNIAPVNNTIMNTPILTRNPDPIFGNYINF